MPRLKTARRLFRPAVQSLEDRTLLSGNSPMPVDPFLLTPVPEDTPLAMHIHVHLDIVIENQPQIIPEGIGLRPDGDLPIHTHDDSGTIHIESPIVRDFHLQDVFTVWGQPFSNNQILDRHGDATHAITMTVNGRPSAAFGMLVLHDGDHISIREGTPLVVAAPGLDPSTAALLTPGSGNTGLTVTSSLAAASGSRGPSVFPHVTDGAFTDTDGNLTNGPEEWSDVPKVFFAGSGSFLYADQADLDPNLSTPGSPVDTFMLMYDETALTAPLIGDQYFLVSLTTVETKDGIEQFNHYVIHIFTDGTIMFIENGVVQHTDDGRVRATEIEGQKGKVGFGPSPNSATPHVIAEFEIKLGATGIELNGGYSPDPQFWSSDPPDRPLTHDDVGRIQASEAHIDVALLANDTDPDGDIDPSTVRITSMPTHGFVSVNSSGLATYTPDPTFNDSDQFSYTVADAQGVVSDPATVQIHAATLVALFKGGAGTSGSGAGIVAIRNLLPIGVGAMVFNAGEVASAVSFVTQFPADIVLVGHSLGGGAAIEAAQMLQNSNTPVARLVQIDSVGAGDEILPANVAAGLNFFQIAGPNSTMLDQTLTALVTDVVKGSTNADTERLFAGGDRDAITHFTIVTRTEVQHAVRDFVVSGLLPSGPGVTPPNPLDPTVSFVGPLSVSVQSGLTSNTTWNSGLITLATPVHLSGRDGASVAVHFSDGLLQLRDLTGSSQERITVELMGTVNTSEGSTLPAGDSLDFGFHPDQDPQDQGTVVGSIQIASATGDGMLQQSVDFTDGAFSFGGFTLRIFQNAAGITDITGLRVILEADAVQLVPIQPPPPPSTNIINNGVIELGVNNQGDLNAPGTIPSAGDGTTTVGIRFLANNDDGIAPGCPCEGWGVADAGSGVTGFADESTGTSSNLQVLSFTSTASSAVSTVQIGQTFKVTQDYHPSTSPNLYDVTVTIENISATDLTDLRYRRVMDWDIEPTAFSEFVTIVTHQASDVLFTSDDGFVTADPLGSRSSIDFTGEATDNGPDDHGALFDFGFGALAAGASKTFHIYYGAAANQSDAEAALGLVGAEVFSFGQPSTPDGPTLGTPNTFIFAFSEVGGSPVFSPPDADKDGVQDSLDNCPSIPNPDQKDSNFNGIGDVCETAGQEHGTAAFLQAGAGGVTTVEPTSTSISQEPGLVEELSRIVRFRVANHLTPSAEVLTSHLVGSLVNSGLLPADQASGLTSQVLAAVSPPISPNQHYVMQLYRDLLHREADMVGLGFATALDQGAVNRFQVVLAIQASSEFQSNVVADIYHRRLGREVDPIGMAGGTGFLRAGGTASQLEAHIIASDEYFANRGGSDIGRYLEAIYHDVFGRSLDSVGRAGWGGVLQGGGELEADHHVPLAARFAVAQAILQSQEASLDVVQGLYAAFLHRAADAVGLAAAANALQNGVPAELVLMVIAGSQENFARSQSSSGA